MKVQFFRFFASLLVILTPFAWFVESVSGLAVSQRPTCSVNSPWNTTLPSEHSSDFNLRIRPLGIFRASAACILYGTITNGDPLTNRFFAVELTEGTLLWTRVFPGTQIAIRNAEVAANGILYLGVDQVNSTALCTALYSIDLVTGKDLWLNQHCISPNTRSITSSGIVLFTNRSLESANLIVQVSSEFSMDWVPLTLIEVLNTQGRILDSVQVGIGVPWTEVIEDGMSGFFIMFGLAGKAPAPEFAWMWHVSRAGNLTLRWQDMEFDFPQGPLSNPMVLRSLNQSTQWFGVAASTGAHVWSANYTDETFLSPAWPNGINPTFDLPIQYAQITPPDWSHQPNRSNRALFYGEKFADFNNCEMIYFALATYDIHTGNQIAMSETVIMNLQAAAPSRYIASRSPSSHSSSVLSQRNGKGRPIEAPQYCQVFASFGLVIELQDLTTDTLFFNTDSLLYVLDADTLKTLKTVPLPNRSVDCINVVPFSLDGSSFGFPGDGLSSFIIGIPSASSHPS